MSEANPIEPARPCEMCDGSGYYHHENVRYTCHSCDGHGVNPHPPRKPRPPDPRDVRIAELERALLAMAAERDAVGASNAALNESCLDYEQQIAACTAERDELRRVVQAAQSWRDDPGTRARWLAGCDAELADAVDALKTEQR